MSSNIENSKDWLIHIGERVSLSFKDSSLSQDSKDILTAKLLFHDTDSKKL